MSKTNPKTNSYRYKYRLSYVWLGYVKYSRLGKLFKSLVLYNKQEREILTEHNNN